MSQEALPCIVCHRALLNVINDASNQPNDGLAFDTHGHYGSTVFDPMDGTALEINVCDKCLTAAAKAGRVYWNQRWLPVYLDLEDGMAPAQVGRHWVDRPQVSWDPEVERTSIREAGLFIEVHEVGTDMPSVEWSSDWPKIVEAMNGGSGRVPTAEEHLRADIEKEKAREDRDDWSRAFVYGMEHSLRVMKENP